MKQLWSYALALLCMLLLSTVSHAQYQEGSVPDGMKNYTLLVMKAEQGVMQKLFNKKLKAALEAHYKGPFELVSKEELQAPEYADLTKYRYTVAVDLLSHNTQTRQTSYGRTTRSQSTVDLFFTDRSANKRLPNTGILSASYITSMRNLGLYLNRNQK